MRQELLRRDDVDAVIVATHHPTHASIGCDVLEAGKHLLVQKPLTTNLALQAQPAWSPDGRSILISGSANGRGEIYLVDVATGSALRLTRGLEGIR